MPTDDTPDPTRSFAVLWRTHEAVSRKGHPDLSVERIARAAIEIADGQGLTTLSMRRTAEHLGVGTMSLYTYVPGKSELIDVMVDTVYGETDRTPAPPGDWRTHLHHVARENWDLHRRHRWLLQVPAQRAVLGPQAIAKYDYELSGLDGIGLTDVEMDAVLSLVLSHVHGAASTDAESVGYQQDSGMSEQQWWETLGPMLAEVLDTDSYPIASRVGTAAGQTHGAPFSATHQLDFGLGRILDGVERLIADRP
jgi:AcrR family transcriptional regulator